MKIRFELKKKDENNMNRNVISVLYTIVMLVGIMVCFICEIAISRTLAWSLIVLSSTMLVWASSFPIILLGKKGVLVAMVSISILTIPYIYLLSVLIKANQVFHIGAILSVYSLVFVWVIYALYIKLKGRKLLATGFMFLLAIPFTLLINSTLSIMIGEPPIEVSDVLSIFALLIAAFAFIIADYARRKGYVKQ